MPICLDSGEDFRYLRKNYNESERMMVNNWWREYTSLFGTHIEYYSYNYSLTGQDFLYGEQPLASFASAVEMIVLADISNDSLLLNQFGIQSQADLTMIIPIETFIAVFGVSAEPKADDVVRLSELGWDRPGAARPYPGNVQPDTAYTKGTTKCVDIDFGDKGTNTDPLSTGVSNYAWTRGAPLYQITERRDDNIPAGINNLLGHYVWIIQAKRFDYSYESNITPEPGSEQITDETLIGELSGGVPQDRRSYSDNITDDSNTEWDYDSGETDRDEETYGDY